MEMHRRLGLACGARGKSQQGDVIAAGLDRVEPDRLVQRHPVELGIMVRRAVEVHDLLEKLAGLRARDQFVGDAAVGQRQRNLGLVDDLVSSPARSIGMVLTTTAPALVAASHAATSAGLLPERIRTRLPGLTP